jgi:competence protein ComEA
MQRLMNLVIIVAVVATATGAVVLALRDSDMGEPIEIIPPTTIQPATVAQSSELKGYVTGAVQSLGLYAVKEGEQLAEVIDLAGGTTEEADLLAVNLAIRVKDQDHWYIPVVGEQPLVQSAGAGTATSDDKIDVNASDAKLLEILPGTGEVRAQAIIQYREQNGPFKRIDDLLDVPGIRPAILEGLRDLIEAR